MATHRESACQTKSLGQLNSDFLSGRGVCGTEQWKKYLKSINASTLNESTLEDNDKPFVFRVINAYNRAVLNTKPFTFVEKNKLEEAVGAAIKQISGLDVKLDFSQQQLNVVKEKIDDTTNKVIKINLTKLHHTSLFHFNESDKVLRQPTQPANAIFILSDREGANVVSETVSNQHE